MKVFSVIIITRNRATIIRNVLESIRDLDYPRDRFELVIVDNNSTDGTSDTIGNYMDGSDIAWKIVQEPVVGMCRARNRGIAHTNGNWVAFLDDDALVPENWLDAYQQAIGIYPQASALGGPATLDVRLDRPWWWCSKFDITMSCQDYGEIMMPYRRYTHPYGLNMVFNRDVLDKYNGFDVTLDTIIPGLADETDLFFRLSKNRELLVYVPAARVVHSVLPDRLKWVAFSKRCIHMGRTFACLDARYNTRTNRPLVRRLISALVESVRYPTPALFIKECLEWYGYIRFDKKQLLNLQIPH